MPVLDHGRDYYAAVTWNGAPDGKRYAIGWMSHWSYTGSLPTNTWRQAMTIAREYKLKTVDGRLQVVSTPVEALDTLRDSVAFTADNLQVTGQVALEGVSETSYELEVSLDPGTAARSGIKVLVGDGEETVIGYDRDAGEIYLDRTRSGTTSFSPSFPSVSRGAVQVGQDGLIHLRVLVDRSSVEVFAQGGETVITSVVFPSPNSTGVRLFAEGGSAKAPHVTIHRLADYRTDSPAPPPEPTASPSGGPGVAPSGGPGTEPGAGASGSSSTSPSPTAAPSRPLAQTGTTAAVLALIAALALAGGTLLKRRHSRT